MRTYEDIVVAFAQCAKDAMTLRDEAAVLALVCDTDRETAERLLSKVATPSSRLEDPTGRFAFTAGVQLGHALATNRKETV